MLSNFFVFFSTDTLSLYTFVDFIKNMTRFSFVKKLILHSMFTFKLFDFLILIFDGENIKLSKIKPKVLLIIYK